MLAAMYCRVVTCGVGWPAGVPTPRVHPVQYLQSAVLRSAPMDVKNIDFWGRSTTTAIHMACHVPFRGLMAPHRHILVPNQE